MLLSKQATPLSQCKQWRNAVCCSSLNNLVPVECYDWCIYTLGAVG